MSQNLNKVLFNALCEGMIQLTYLNTQAIGCMVHPKLSGYRQDTTRQASPDSSEQQELLTTKGRHQPSVWSQPFCRGRVL